MMDGLLLRMQLLKSSIRHRWEKTIAGSAMVSSLYGEKSRICFVAGTRKTEEDFWRESPLGVSLKRLERAEISSVIFFENKRGLPGLYNQAMAKSDADIIVFLHDDVWLMDESVIDEIRRAVRIFDVAGVAGNTRILRNQPAWLFKRIEGGNFLWDTEYLSGAVVHGSPENNQRMIYGAFPARCELMDGLFFAARRKIIRKEKVEFDERFDFHFYDMDFCRSARRAGMRLGTWGFNIIHESAGGFGGEQWMKNYEKYLNKWKG